MATIRDIAAASGVSAGAVSRILNNDTTLNVTAATRQHVLEVAASLGYVKKSRVSKASSSVTFGILQWFSPSQELDDPYYLSVRLGIEDYCMSHKIKVIRAFRSDPEYAMLLSGVDALLCIGKFDDSELEAFSRITNRLFLVDMYTNKSAYNSISLDFESAVLEVMKTFSSRGVTKVGYLGGKEYLNDTTLYPDKRRELFVSYAREHNMTYQPYILEEDFSSDSGYRMMQKLIKSNTLPQAIFAGSDNIAIGALRALAENGIKVPEDISVIGFDDISAASYTTPRLSTVHAPSFEMGNYAAAFLDTGFDTYNKLGTPLHMTLPCKLVLRES